LIIGEFDINQVLLVLPMANKIQRILVPLDGSQNSTRALEKAITIAQPTGATITGLYVIHIPARSAIRFTPQQRKKEISFAESIISEAAEKVERAQVNFKPRTETGDPGQKIAQVAKDSTYDLVVIGSRGRSTGKEMFLGSVSNYVLHKTNMPVMVVK
jgi:nucleotide-binding universal stress UspA family protein